MIRTRSEPADPPSRSALHFAAATGNARITRILCEAGAEIDLRDKDGERSEDRPISLAEMRAARARHEAAVWLCMCPQWGCRCTHIYTSHRAIMRRLWTTCGQRCDQPAYIWSVALSCLDPSGYTPIHMAAGYLHTPVVELLLHYGSDPEIRDREGRTVLELVENLKASRPSKSC